MEEIETLFVKNRIKYEKSEPENMTFLQKDSFDENEIKKLIEDVRNKNRR